MGLHSFAAMSGSLSTNDIVAQALKSSTPVDRGRGRNTQDSGWSEAGAAAQSSLGEPSRQFRHARNANGGVDSICQKCQAVIASSTDEWSLLAHEARHVCRSPGNPMAGDSEIHKQKGK